MFDGINYIMLGVEKMYALIYKINKLIDEKIFVITSKDKKGNNIVTIILANKY